MITITHPNATEGSVEASGLTFVDGKAEVAQFDDAARAVLVDHGFTFDGEPEEPEVEEIVGQKLEDLKRADIDALAAERGIDTTGAKNKAEAIAIIEASPLVPVLGDEQRELTVEEATAALEAGESLQTAPRADDESAAPAS